MTDFGLIQAIWTIVVMIVFPGIVIWAWSKKRKKDFDEAAMIPFDDEESENNT